MRFSRLFSKRKKAKSKINRHANHPTWGRLARMEILEDRRVLANFYVFGNGDSIQAAIDDAENNPGPDTVFLKSDYYTQELNISDSDPLTIVGLGRVTLNPGTFTGGIIDIVDSKHVTLKNLTIQNAYQEDNIDADNTYKLEFHDVRSLNAGDDGLDADDVDYIFAHNSKFNDNGDNGLELRDVGYAYLKNVHANYNGTGILGLLTPVPENESNYNGLSYENGENGSSDLQAFVDGYAQGLNVYGGEFNWNGNDGIHTEGLYEIKLKMVYANDNEDDGVDTSDEISTPYSVDVNYATFKRNGEDGLNTTADYVEITSTRAWYNDEDGVDVDDSYDAYIYYSNFSHNGETGLEVSDVSKVVVDWIGANYNGSSIPNTGASFENVDDLDITTAEFNNNYGPGIYVEMNYGGHTYINYVDASGNTRDGLLLVDGSAHIESFSSNYNYENGIRAVGLKNLYINNSESKYNGYNGLLILSGRMTGLESTNGQNGQYRGTDVYIVWSEFVGNHEDGIHAENAGKITLDRMQSIYNWDDGFESINPYERAKVIDSLFAHNGDYNFIERFGVPV